LKIDSLNRHLQTELRKRKLTHAQMSARLDMRRNNLTRRLTGVTPWLAEELLLVSKILGYGTLSEMLKEAGL